MKRVITSIFSAIIAFAIIGPVVAHEGKRGYEGYHGYRERPYDRGRHYGHFKHKGHKYDYHGHWRSWDDWNRYLERYPHWRRHGRYYHDGAHLMYRFCDPDTDTCIFFSIGR